MRSINSKWLLLTAFIMGGVMNQLFSQNTSLIQLVPNPTLTDHQDSLLDIIKHDSFTTGWRFCSLNNLTAVQDSGCIKIELPFISCENLIFQSTYVDYQNDSNYYWAGEIPSDTNDYCHEGFFNLTKYKGIYTGRLQLGDSFYHIQDLLEGLLVISNEESDVDSLTYDSLLGTQGPVTSRTAGQSCEVKVTKILMCFSQAAQNRITNIEVELKNLVNLANQALANSYLNESIEMVGALKYHGFVENNIESDLESFSTNATINNWRDNLHADLCALVTREYVNKGGSGDIGASLAKTANLYNKTAGYLSCGITRGGGKQLVIVHEIGHAYRGDHQYIQSSGCAHAHSFNIGIKGYYTAIITGLKAGSTKIIVPYYSNPNVNYKKNKPTGTSPDHNNCCSMVEYKEYVRTYYTEQNTFHVETEILTKGDCNTTWSVYSYLYCGTGPYQYYWEVSYDGINFTLLSTSNNLTVTPPSPPNGQKYGVMVLKLKVKDSNNNWATNKRSYKYACPNP